MDRTETSFKLPVKGDRLERSDLVGLRMGRSELVQLRMAMNMGHGHAGCHGTLKPVDPGCTFLPASKVKPSSSTVPTKDQGRLLPCKLTDDSTKGKGPAIPVTGKPLNKPKPSSSARQGPACKPLNKPKPASSADPIQGQGPACKPPFKVVASSADPTDCQGPAAPIARVARPILQRVEVFTPLAIGWCPIPRQPPLLHSSEVMVWFAYCTEGQEFLLCTVLCDLLVGLPTLWNEERSLMIRDGLESCCGVEDRSGGTTYWLDVRGRYIEEVKQIFEIEFDRKRQLLTHAWCLKIRVGCRDHGVGEGKLFKAVIGLLEVYKDDDSVKWSTECGGSVISINYAGSGSGSQQMEQLSFLSGLVNDFLLGGASTKIMEEKAAEMAGKMDNKVNLCTIACDVLFDLERPVNQYRDGRTIGKILISAKRAKGEVDRR